MGGRTYFWQVALVVACCAAAVGARADESKEAKEFKNAKRGIQQQLRSRKSQTRVAAVRKLAEYPTTDAARLLVQVGLSSQDEDVCKAAHEVLLQFREIQEVCDYLVTEVKKSVNRGGADPGTCRLLAVLLASKLDGVEKRAMDLLEAAAASPKGGVLLLVSLADELGDEGGEINTSTLVTLSKSPLMDRDFALRRAVVQALTRVDQIEAVDALLDLIYSVKGEVRADILVYLCGITGQQFGLDGKAWHAWWEANREGFTFPPVAQRAAGRAALVAKTTSYYGLPVYASRLLFILDTSASMKGARIEAAKRELINAITNLPTGVYFGVLVFNSRVTAWQNDLMPANPVNKELAAAFVRLQGLALQTASFDALEAAFNFDTEAVYFLTDGEPYGGKITKPDEIVSVIGKLNRARRMTINTIGIGVEQPGSVFDRFLKSLAEQNYGEYKRVDQ
ncbi:MAG TPA: VWA domain-containing protein [Pirellulales bacterium]|nr:VWA domain-containing protein [Pirellulales bacterium]